MDNYTRTGSAGFLLALGFGMGYWVRTIGNYFWEWQHRLAPVSQWPEVGGLIALLSLAMFASGVILFLIGIAREE
jgi:hypothetical protein